MAFQKAQWPRKLRSQEWYGGTSRDTIYHRGWLKNQGYPHDLFDGRPVIGILNTWSDLTPCNGHLRELAEKVKAGVWEAGGFPLEVPVFSASIPPPPGRTRESRLELAPGSADDPPTSCPC